MHFSGPGSRCWSWAPNRQSGFVAVELLKFYNSLPRVSNDAFWFARIENSSVSFETQLDVGWVHAWVRLGWIRLGRKITVLYRLGWMDLSLD